MAFNVGFNYNNYGNKIVSLADEYKKVADKLQNAIGETIPSDFSGSGADAAKRKSQQIVEALRSASSKLRRTGNNVVYIANNEDVQ